MRMSANSLAGVRGNRRAGGGSRGRNDTLYLELSEGVHEACVCHVDEEVKMAEEICTKDGLLDIREDEYPTKGAAETSDRVP